MRIVPILYYYLSVYRFWYLQGLWVLDPIPMDTYGWCMKFSINSLLLGVENLTVVTQQLRKRLLPMLISQE